MDQNKNKKIVIFNNKDELWEYLVKKWFLIGRESLAKKGFFNVALSGGKTPVELYHRLSKENMGFLWEKTHIFQVDERFGDAKDCDNNWRLIQDNLLTPLNISSSNMHPVAIKETAGLSALDYEEKIKIFFNLKEAEFPKFDLLLLGIGKDGHTASLFPETGAMDEKNRLTLNLKGDNIDYERISLTLPVINNAKCVLFVVTGADKSDIIREVIDGKNKKLPASLVDPESGELLYLFDYEAASLLREKEK
ncbi:MAG: 6-phosphogluconolactonase [Candidatus Omnitrophota bacterium]